MENDSSEDLYSILDDIIALLEEFAELLNCHLVNFITKNHFDNLLPKNIANELIQLTDVQLCQMPSGQLKAAEFDHLNLIIERCKNLSFPNILRRSKYFELATAQHDDFEKYKKRPNLNSYMSVKKSHEVEQMACSVSLIADNLKIKNIVDVGSGRGYLSSLLAMYFGKTVVGLDISDGNTQSALKRQENLARHWKSVLKRVQENSKPNDDSLCSGSYTPVTCHVNTETDFGHIFCENFGTEPIIVAGLHTCGDLAGHTINMFLDSPQARYLCLVGCCYHLIEEHFSPNPFWKPEDDPAVTFYGFPMSKHLLCKRVKIGRNARILASQPVNRMADNLKLPNIALYWRSLLQKIVCDKYKEINIFENQVGSIAKNCANFYDYVCKALKKLSIDIPVSEEETKEYLATYAIYQRKLNAYFQFRCLFAPVVETLVLLDRLCCLLEAESVKDAKIVQLFDPSKSPRCYALFASKN